LAEHVAALSLLRHVEIVTTLVDALDGFHFVLHQTDMSSEAVSPTGTDTSELEPVPQHGAGGLAS
jgi:hypothetical protein